MHLTRVQLCVLIMFQAQRTLRYLLLKKDYCERTTTGLYTLPITLTLMIYE